MEQSHAFAVGDKLPMNSSENYAPWGDNGVKLNNVPTSAEAITQAGLDWDVELRPCQCVTSDGKTVTMPNKRMVVRKTDNHPLSVVGSQWKPLQNKDAFSFFDQFVEKGLCEYETAGFINNGEKIWIMAKIKADPFEVIKNDVIDSYFLLTNVHNTTNAGRVIFTNLRMACLNILPSIEKSAKQAKIYHMGNITSALKNVAEICDMRRTDFQSTQAQYQFLASKGAKEKQLEEYVDMVLEKGVYRPKNTNVETIEVDESKHKRAKKVINELMETGRGTEVAGVKGTWWGAYNAMTEYYSHEQGRKVDTRLNSIFYGEGNKKSVKALQLALDFAKVA